MQNFRQDIDQPVFRQLREIAVSLQLPAYVIGGFVRDLILGREHKNDIDVVVEGRGVEFAKAFAEKVGAKDVIVYDKFMTAMVRYDDYEVEFVGARKESYRRDSRKPIVEDGTLYDDQLRRDFTINALSISLNETDFGELHDPFGGLADLENKLIRTPTDPDVTFSDDPLRMIRGIRFATQLGFSIEGSTWSAIERNASRIEIVSQERITTELNKIILAPKPSVGLSMLFDARLLQLFFSEMADLEGVEVVDGKAHKDNFYHTLKVLDNLAETTDDLWLRWSAVLHDIAKPATKRFNQKVGWTFHGHEDRGARMVSKIFKKLKLPLDAKMKYVEKLVRLHLRPIALVDETVTDSAIRRLIVDAGEDLPDLMKLCRADITTRDPRKVQRYLRNFDVVEMKVEEVAERDQLRNWQPPVDGEMIMSHFDIPPSKIVGDIKNAIREAILEGDIPNDKEAALELMKKLGAEMLGKE